MAHESAESKGALVDVLEFGSFRKIGPSKTIQEAQLAGDWIGSFNLWVVRRWPVPTILYQLRPYDSHWAPGLLDVAVGGRYDAGERLEDGLREAREELGKNYPFGSLVNLGKKIQIEDTAENRKLRYVVDVCLVEDNADLETFTPQREELLGLFLCPVDQLLDVHSGDLSSFLAQGVMYDGGSLKSTEIRVDSNSFPVNWDRYHYKMTTIIANYFRGDTILMY